MFNPQSPFIWTFSRDWRWTVQRFRERVSKFQSAGKKSFPSLFDRYEKGRYLFPGQLPLVPWFFSRSPTFVWFWTMVVSLVAIVYIPFRLHIHTLSEIRADGTPCPNGIWYEPGWSFMFVGLLPCILALCSSAGHKMIHCIGMLEGSVFVPDPNVPDSLAEALRKSMGNLHTRATDGAEPATGKAVWFKRFSLPAHFPITGTVISLGLLVACSTLATMDCNEAAAFHENSYRERRELYRHDITESLNALTTWTESSDLTTPLPTFPAPSPPKKNWVLESPGWYLALIYGLEGLSLFLGLSFIVSFLCFLMAFSAELRPEKTVKNRQNSGYQFVPQLFDPQKRLGLSCLGEPINRCVMACLLLQLDVLVLRFDRIARANNQPIFTYPDELVRLIPLSIHAHDNPIQTIYELSRMALAQVRADEMMFLILVPLIYLGCIVLPLQQIRRYIQRSRDQEWKSIAKDYESAIEADDKEKARRLRTKLDAISESDSWPNGGGSAIRFHWAMAALAMGAWLPPLLVCITALGIGVAAYGWLASFSPFKVSGKAAD